MTYSISMTREKTPEHKAKLIAAAHARKGRKLDPEFAARVADARRASGMYTRGHNMHGTPTYNSWSTMIQRCTNPQATGYSYYGARGVSVCDRWRSFSAFFEDMGLRPDGMTIDRIDNEGDYEPGNCRWADHATQQANRRAYKPREVRVNECGHPQKPHKARGMCGACYLRARLAGEFK